MSEVTKKERVHELLADSAAFGLETAEQKEFEDLKREFPEMGRTFGLRLSVKIPLNPYRFPFSSIDPV